MDISLGLFAMDIKLLRKEDHFHKMDYPCYFTLSVHVDMCMKKYERRNLGEVRD